MLKRLRHSLADYVYSVHQHSYAFLFRRAPEHYLGKTVAGKNPVLIIPGIFERWQFLKSIGDDLSHRGHPVYTLDFLGNNTGEIEDAATAVKNFLADQDLRSVVVLAHSQGGLVAKYLAAFADDEARIKKIIAVATPFAGSKMVDYLPLSKVKKLAPGSAIIKKLQEQKEVNKKIVSIFGVFDNHIWPVASCRLEGAKNLEVEEYGHHKILLNKKVISLIVTEADKD